MANRLGVNYLFSLSLKISEVLFPLITFPYVSRILGPEGVGKVNFAQSYIGYFIIFAALGIPAYGVRAVARVAKDPIELGKVTSELMVINSLFIGIASLLLLPTLFLVPQIRNELPLFGVASVLLVFNMFSVDWFFSGREDYRFIAIRNIGVKMGYVVAVYALVHRPSDYVVFAFLGVAVNLATYGLNFRYVMKNVRLTFRGLHWGRHLRPILSLFLMTVAVSFYYTLTPILLGFFSESDQVGYFATFLKILLLATALISAYTNVLFPRFSRLRSEGKMTEYLALSVRASSLVHAMVFPMIAVFLVFGEEIVRLLAGESFVGHVSVLWAMTPVLYLSSISLLVQANAILPFEREGQVAWVPVVGAVVSLGLSLVLIPNNGALGSAFALTAAELIVAVAISVVAKRTCPLVLWTGKTLVYALIVGALAWSCHGILAAFHPGFVATLGLGLGFLILCAGALVLVREPTFVEILGKFWSRFRTTRGSGN